MKVKKSIKKPVALAPPPPQFVVCLLLFFSCAAVTAQTSTAPTEDTTKAVELSEVVVTGYTAQTKKSITGGVSVVNMDEVRNMPDGNALNAIQGRVTGITIGKSGGPGGQNIVRIRGFSNVSSNEPLYIIDGVPTQDGTIFNAINPSDIASVQVLKDASAAAIYGARANNGVIIVTTKTGKGKSTTSFSVNYTAGYQTPRTETFPDFLNPQEYGDLLWTRFKNGGEVPKSALYGSGTKPVVPKYLTKDGGVSSVNVDDYKLVPGQDNNPIREVNPAGTKWFEQIFAPSWMHNVSLSAAKSSDKSDFYFSSSYHSNSGIIRYTNFSRYTARINSNFQVNKFLKVGESFTASYYENKGSARTQDDLGPVTMSYRLMPIIPVYDIKGKFASSNGKELGDARNTLALLSRNQNDLARNLLVLGNVYGEISIIEGLQFKSMLSLNYLASNATNFEAKRLEDQEQAIINSFTESNYLRLEQTFANFLTYNRVFNKHNVAALLGIEYINRVARWSRATRFSYDLEDDNFITLSSGGATGQTNSGSKNEQALFSVFGKVDYNFAGKYFVSVTLRNDETSRFLPKNRSKLFPSVGVAWMIAEEDFLKNSSIISKLKLRAAWGQTGNQETPARYPTYTTLALSANNNNYTTYQGYAASSDGNPNITWEVVTSFDVGLEVGLWDNRLNLDLGYYNKETSDMLVHAPRPATAGLAANPWVNVGTMQNSGFEIALSHQNEFRQGWSYNIGFNLSINKNEILKLLDNDKAFISGSDFRGLTPTRISKGYPISHFYGYVVDGYYKDATEVTKYGQFNGAVGGFKYKDVNGDGKITTDDRTYLGSPLPSFTYGISLGVAYKGLALTAFLEGQQGNSVFNFIKYFTDLFGFVGAVSRRALDYYDPSKNNQNAQSPYLSSKLANMTEASSYYVEDASFLRLRNIQLSYTFNLTKTPLNNHIKSLKVYFQVENAFVITKYSGLDPEVNLPQAGSDEATINYTLGVDRGIYPNPRSFLLGININF